MTGAEGESILWQGSPDPLRFSVHPFNALFAAFALLFGGLFVTAVVGVGSLSVGRAFLFVVAFAPAAGAAVALALAWRESRRTRYTLTNRRILIETGAFRRRDIELDLATLPYLERAASVFGTSTIFFAPQGPYGSWGWWTGHELPAFRAISNGERVYRLISEARAALRKP